MFAQDGYSVAATAAERAALLTYIPIAGGHQIEVRKGDVAVVFEWLTTELAKIEPVMWPGVWGFAFRPIRGQSSGFSNHAAGCAVDWDAPLHPRYSVRDTSKRYVGWSSSQVAAIRRLLAYAGGVLRWGADYVFGPLDPMHFEINASPAAVHALANKIRAVKPATSGDEPVKTSDFLRSGDVPQAIPANEWTDVGGWIRPDKTTQTSLWASTGKHLIASVGLNFSEVVNGTVRFIEKTPVASGTYPDAYLRGKEESFSASEISLDRTVGSAAGKVGRIQVRLDRPANVLGGNATVLQFAA